MLARILEPEVMDTEAEAVDYDSMDHAAVNRVFVDDFLAAWRPAHSGRVLDIGTGTAQIPIELCGRHEAITVTAIDLAAEMLKVAQHNVAVAGLKSRVLLERIDAKSLPFDNGSFDAVVSNSIVHHIPDPTPVFAEMWRVLRPGGLMFVRDLLRPSDAAALEHLVQTYAGRENAHQQQMFRDSLHAAFTLQEIEQMLANAGLPNVRPQQTTDRHWTVVSRKSH